MGKTKPNLLLNIKNKIIFKIFKKNLFSKKPPPIEYSYIRVKENDIKTATSITHCNYDEMGSPCRRPLFDGNYCIFHSPDIEKKKATFDKLFWTEFTKQETSSEKFNFGGFIFPESIDFSNKKFEKEVIFSCSKFYGEVTNFTESIFKTVQFSFAEFHSNETYFFGTKFNSDVDFLSATISSNKTIFIKAEFKGRTIFASILFSGNIVNFGNSKFLNNYVSFDHCQISCKYAWFENVYFKAVKISFDDAYINNVNGLFESLRFRTKLGIIKYKIDNFRFNLGEETTKTNPVLARKSRDDWYINDFKSEHPNIYFIWNLSSKCGESLYRWTLWSVFIALLFSLIYQNCFYLNDPSSIKIIGHINETWPFISFIYFSVVTFTTLGFGDLIPNNGWLQFWVTIEVIIGYIMLGGLISIFSSKLARRS